MSESTFKQTGRIYKIGEAKQISANFTVREFRIETESQYSQKISFQLVNDRETIIDKFAIGDLVEVSFDVRGRDWSKEGKEGNMTTLNAWRIEKVGGEQPTAATENYTVYGTPPAPSAPQAAPVDDSAAAIFGDPDDLPF